MRRLLLIVDMEGVAGVESLAQITAGFVEYEAARRLLTAETNAMVSGFIQAGFEQVVISDSHEGGATTSNLLVAELDKRARLETTPMTRRFSGTPMPLPASACMLPRTRWALLRIRSVFTATGCYRVGA